MAVDAGQAAKYRGRRLDDIDVDGQYGTPSK